MHKKNSLVCLLAAMTFPAFAQQDNTTPAAELSTIVVTAPAENDAALAVKRLSSGDTASLLSDEPGVSLYTGGGISNLPVMHGLADDRLKILIDGREATAACANHMNPPLSYVSPASVAKINVMAGITPVSMGGDSIGGTIVVESAPPVFAAGNETLHKEGSLSLSGRSNNGGAGAAVAASIASDTTSLAYSGSVDRAGDYKDGQGNTVTSTYYKVENQAVTFAAQGRGNLLTVKLGQQIIPGQGFVNEYMDMISNHATFLNANYKGDFAWGQLDAKFYWQDTRHEMNIGNDKSTFPMPMWMPMETHGKDIGYSLQADMPLSQQNTLRLGNEFHRFMLDDWWPAVAGTSPYMGPNTFQNINDGHRDRFSLFGEWESRMSPQWLTLLGLRSDIVRMDTGSTQGYSNPSTPNYAADGVNYAADAAAFNAQGHARRDNNWDLTALVRYEPDPVGTFEAGYARKTRSPNLDERYTWSTYPMAAEMINWFGDGNYYVGNPNLKPEVANTISATADWHDNARKKWQFKITPYYTYVQDYIGVNVLGTNVMGMGFNELQFANHDARLYGLDLSGKVGLWDNSQLGYGQLKGTAGYVRGQMTGTNTPMYHMMPLNVRLTLEQYLNAWINAFDLQLVDRKSEVDPLRNEPATSGYALANVRTGYQWQNVRVDAGISNLFNKFYYLPLGGVNIDSYMTAGQIGAVAGQGRSFNVVTTIRF